MSGQGSAPVTIRSVNPARAADLRAVAAVARATWPVAYRGILADGIVARHLRTAYKPAALAARLGLDGGLFLLAEAQEDAGGRAPRRAVAFCQAGRRLAAPGEADLWAIYVRPEWQGRGIGRRLVERAALALPGCRLHVALAARNLAAAGFYVALGFRAEGRGYAAALQGTEVEMRSMVRDPSPDTGPTAGGPTAER